MSRPRAVRTPEPVVLDEVAAAHRYRWLERFVTLTDRAEGVLIEHRGTLAQRLQHIEQELDRVGRRAEAEAFLAYLERGSERTREHIADLRRGSYAA
jgi:hypothetical protein